MLISRKEQGPEKAEYSRSPVAFLRTWNWAGVHTDLSSRNCQPGDHPIFIDKPLVLEVNPTTVEVSWFNVVSKAECASRFFVQTKNTKRQGAGRVSNLLPQTQRSLIVEYLEVDQVYTFQVRVVFLASSIDFFSLVSF